MWKSDYDDETRTTQFTSHYEDLKRAIGRTLTPRLATLPYASFSSPSTSPRETTETETDTAELSLDLRYYNDDDDDDDYHEFRGSFHELRSHRLGDRVLPSPKNDRSRSRRTPRSDRSFRSSGRDRSQRTPRSARSLSNPRTDRSFQTPRSDRSQSNPRTDFSSRRTSRSDRSLSNPRTDRSSLQTPRSARSNASSTPRPPSPRGLTPRTPRTPRYDNYPPSPRSRSNSPPKTPISPPRRRVSRSPPKSPHGRGGSVSPPKTPRARFLMGQGGYYDDESEYSAVNYSPPSMTPRTPRSSRSPRKCEQQYPEVLRPPPYLDTPLSARSKASSGFSFGDGIFADIAAQQLTENGVSYLYPDDVRRMLAQNGGGIGGGGGGVGGGGSSTDKEGGMWTRREKLLILLLLFAVVTVVVLFLVVFLVMSGVLGSAHKTEIYNYAPSQAPAYPNPGVNITNINTTVNRPPTTATATTTTTPSGGSSSSKTAAPTITPVSQTKSPPSQSTVPTSKGTVAPATTATTATTTTATTTITTTTKKATVITTRKPVAVINSTPSSTTARTIPTTTTAPPSPPPPPTTTTAATTTSSTTMPKPIIAPPITTMTTKRTPPPTTATTTTTTTTTTPPPPPPTTTTTTTTTPRPTTTTAKTPLSCSTQKCVAVGRAVKESLSQATGGVSDCTNFYANACGKNDKSASTASTFSEEFSPLFNVVLGDMYTRSAEILSGPVPSSATEGERVAKAIYGACIASNTVFTTFPAITEMYSLFRDLGFNTEVTSALSIDVMQQTALEQYGAGPLFTVRREPVFDGQRFKYMALISPPTLVFDPSLYDPSKPQQRIRQSEDTYITTLTNVFYSWFAINSQGEPPSDLGDKLQARLKQVLVFEKELKRLLPDGTADWMTLETETVSVSQLQLLAPAVSWSLVLGKGPRDQVRVYYKGYLQLLNTLLQKTDASVVKTYIMYHVLFNHAWRFAPKVLRETMQGFLLRDFLNVYSDSDCAKLTYDVAHRDASQLVMYSQRETFLAELSFTQSVATKLIDELRNTFNGLGWLSSVTRRLIVDKLSTVSFANPTLMDLPETVSTDLPPDVSSKKSLMTNAINRLRSAATEEYLLDGVTVDRPTDFRFDFSPVYSLTTNSLYFPIAFIHLGSWLKDTPELLPLYQYLLTRSLLHKLLHPASLGGWSDPSITNFGARKTCLSDNPSPALSDTVSDDHMLHLITAAFSMQFMSKNYTSGAASEPLTLGTEIFDDNMKFRFHLMAQGFCVGDIYSRFGALYPAQPKPEKELNFAVANDPFYGTKFYCDPGLPMAGTKVCSVWDYTLRRNRPSL